MHQGLDFLFETVNNSIEAKATTIDINYVDNGEDVNITIVDNGLEKLGNDCLLKGKSTKGGNRGKGLYLLNKQAKDLSIKQLNQGVKLNYSYSYENLGQLSEVLPFLFSNQADISFTYNKGDYKETISSKELKKQYSCLEDVLTISKLKANFSKFDIIKES